MSGPQAHLLPDRRRLHLNHGPIDLIVEAVGASDEVARAYMQAKDRFATVLTELAAELDVLRRPSQIDAPRPFAGAIAARMERAACRMADRFVTPMAAVAGAVAEEVLAALLADRLLDAAHVNNGGDIALALRPDGELAVAIAGTGDHDDHRFVIRGDGPVRGIATSGWRGRSHSLGIADAVTVLARNASCADVAATLIANEVDLPGNAAIERMPANALSPNTDLGARPVTVNVAALSSVEVSEALEGGTAVARQWVESGLIVAAFLFLGGQRSMVGPPDLALAVGEASPGGGRRGCATSQRQGARGMRDFTIRKIAVFVEEIHHDGGEPADTPRLRGAAMALVRNPFAGSFVADLQPSMDDLRPLGLMLTDRLIAALGGDASAIDGYGKGAIVGTAGEIEHGALWHVPGGYAMRERLGESKAIVPSAMKMGGFGARLDVPLGHKNAAYVRSHFDSIEISAPDGPRPDEILFVLAMARGGRIHSRMGGLEAWQVKGEDGLR